MKTDEQRPRHDEKALKHFEKRLLQERKLVLRELGVLSEALGATQQARDGDISNYRFHMADQGTDTMEQEKNVLFASQEGRLLWHIDEALRQLYREPESFGICKQCERLIDFDRLDAIPHTKLCITCKKQVESSIEARAASAATSTASAPPSLDAGTDAS